MRRQHKPARAGSRRTRTAKKREAISIRLDEDVRSALDEIIVEESRSLSGQINWVLRQHVEKWKQQQER